MNPHQDSPPNVTGRSSAPGLRSKRNLRAHGFSLIEVTMALGITAMVMVPLLAILPYSMKNMREAIDVSISSRILEEITSEAQLMKFEDVEDMERNGGLRYYDSLGNDVTDSKGNDVVYTARIRVPNQASRDGSVDLPRSSLKIDNYARKILVDVAVTRGTQFDFSDPDNARDIESFSTMVSKLRDDLDTGS